MVKQIDWVGAKSEDAPAYAAAPAAIDDDAIIAKAIAILAGRLQRGAHVFGRRPEFTVADRSRRPKYGQGQRSEGHPGGRRRGRGQPRKRRARW